MEIQLRVCVKQQQREQLLNNFTELLQLVAADSMCKDENNEPATSMI